VIELHAFDDPRASSGALAKAAGDALHASLSARVSARGVRPTTLAVSGGTSPRPFLQTLSTQPFDGQCIARRKKLDVLNAAAAAPQKNAISTLANDKGVRLDVYWCAN